MCRVARDRHPNIVALRYYVRPFPSFLPGQTLSDSLVVPLAVVRSGSQQLERRGLPQPRPRIRRAFFSFFLPFTPSNLAESTLLSPFPQPDTLYRVYRAYSKKRQHFPEILTKLYVYQVRISRLLRLSLELG